MIDSRSKVSGSGVAQSCLWPSKRCLVTWMTRGIFKDTLRTCEFLGYLFMYLSIYFCVCPEWKSVWLWVRGVRWSSFTSLSEGEIKVYQREGKDRGVFLCMWVCMSCEAEHRAMCWRMSGKQEPGSSADLDQPFHGKRTHAVFLFGRAWLYEFIMPLGEHSSKNQHWTPRAPLPTHQLGLHLLFWPFLRGGETSKWILDLFLCEETEVSSSQCERQTAGLCWFCCQWRRETESGST